VEIVELGRWGVRPFREPTRIYCWFSWHWKPNWLCLFCLGFKSPLKFYLAWLT